MARTTEGRRLTEEHKRAQIRLGAIAAALTLENAKRLDPDDLDATEARWKAGQMAIIATMRRRSAALAEEYLLAFCDAEGESPPNFADPDLPSLTDAVDWVVPVIKTRTARYVRG